MTRLRTVAAELAGLFVEDRSFALAIAVWIALVRVAAEARAARETLGLVLFAGLAVVLVTSVVSAARRP